MLHFTSKLAMGTSDDSVHRRLVKYSKGEFDGPVIEVGMRGKTLAISGSPEYEDMVGWIVANCAPPQLEFKVSGTIKSNEDQSERLRSLGWDLTMKKAKGKEKYEVKMADKVLTAEKLRDLYSKLIEVSIILLTLKPTSGEKEWSMTTKKDYPRPSTKGDLKGPDTDFCKAVTPQSEAVIEEVLSGIAPDFKEEIPRPFKQLRLVNLYQIRDVILPENRGNLDFTEIRMKAKRKGVLIRKVSIDGKDFTRSTEFTA